METTPLPVIAEEEGDRKEQDSFWKNLEKIVDKSDEEAELVARYNKRLACWEVVKDVMLNSISHERAKGKGSRYRKHFVTGLRCLLRIFKTEDEEYRAINKFGRGIWAKQYVESFNDVEKELICTFIARKMGAFDY